MKVNSKYVGFLSFQQNCENSFYFEQSLKSWSSTISSEKEELDEKHRNTTDDNAMLLAKVQELQNSIPELEVKCDNLAEKETQLREVIERLETEKGGLLTKQTEIIGERDNLLKRCEEFTQTIYEYDVEKITMAGKMEEIENKLEVTSVLIRIFILSIIFVLIVFIKCMSAFHCHSIPFSIIVCSNLPVITRDIVV